MQLHAIILAAGKGKRMNSKNLPKVLYPLGGKPIVSHVIDLLERIGVRDPIIVVGFQGQKVIDTLGPRYRYVWQRKRLGTAHAAKLAKPFLEHQDGYTFILNGDNPMLVPSTLKRMVAQIQTTKATVAISSSAQATGWQLGILVTNNNGDVIEIVEEKNATADQKTNFPLRNAGAWLVDNRWLWQAIGKIRKNAVSGEYYVTDLLDLAVKQGKKVIAVPVGDPREALGINDPQQLAQAHQWLHLQQKG